MTILQKKWTLHLTCMVLLISLIGLGCGGEPAPLFPREEVDLEATGALQLSYQATTPGTLSLAKIDTLFLPTRIKISSDGTLMLIAQLGGQVVLYQKIDGAWVRQETLFHDLGEITVEGERGLTGMFFGADFDPDSPEPLRREVFLNYQTDTENGFKNRITRVTLSKQGAEFIGVDPIIIYEGPQDPPFAHQIQDGIGFMYEGAAHILISMGDGFVAENALDLTKEGHGKILLMKRDGSDPLGPRPYPGQAKIQAIGLRNAYSLLMLPESLDPRRRVLSGENGNENYDRFWLLELVDFGHEEDAPVSLGYFGEDFGPSWFNIPDLNAPGPQDPEGVLATLNPPISPNSLSLHPGGGFIPVPEPGQAVFLVSYLGPTGSVTNEPGKKIVMGRIDNLGGQPNLTLTPIIEKTPESEGQVGNPLGLEVDPTNGDILFSDILTGELVHGILQ